MGGINESFLKVDKSDKIKDKIDIETSVFKKKSKKYQQKQEIRQHISAGHVHLHDDFNKLKVSIPVADWFVLLNKLKNLKNYSYVDTEFNCVANFNPYLSEDLFEVVIELKPIIIGQRFKQINELTKK